MSLLGLGINILNSRNAGSGINREGLELWKQLSDNVYIDKVTPGNINLTQDFTLELWVLAGDLATNYNLLQKKTSNNVAGYGVYVNNNGTIQLEYSDGVDHFNGTSGTVFSSLRTYYHIGITRTSNEVKFYIDGTLDSTLSNAGAGLGTNSDNLTIGVGSGGYFNFTAFKGFIGDVRIYNRALAAAEVLKNYNLSYAKYKTQVFAFTPEFTLEFK